MGLLPRWTYARAKKQTSAIDTADVDTSANNITDAPSVYGASVIVPKLEAPPGFEPGIKVLQTFALPLGYSAILERITRLELATSTLARWRSTR